MATEDTIIKNLKEKYGKSLEEWIDVVKETGIQKHNQIIKYLKQEHGFTHGFANLVSLKARGRDAASAGSTEELIRDQYKGKEVLYPTYQKLMEVVKDFGDDIEIAPKRAYVSLRRKKQFALVQPSTKTRLDVGINLKDMELTDRLEDSGSFNAMCSHRVRVMKMKDIDNDLILWLKTAYEEAG
jgi:predicted transport protein